MEEQGSKNKSEMWGLSIKDLFYKYLGYLPLIILSLVFAVAGAFIYLRYATKIYNATGLMLIQNEQKNNGSDKVEDILLGSGKIQNIQNEIEVIRSLPLMERVVKRLDLCLSYSSLGKINELNIYKQSPFRLAILTLHDSSVAFTINVKMVSPQVIQVNNSLNVPFGQAFSTPKGVFRFDKIGDVVPGTEFDVHWDDPSEVISRLGSELQVQPKTAGSGILTVSIMSTSPQLSTDVVNAVMLEYGLMTVEQNNFSTDQMLNFINSRLDILNRELDTSQQKLLEYQQQNDLVDVELQSESYFSRINETEKLLVQQEARLNDLGIISAYLSDRENKFSRVTVPTSFGIEDVTLMGLVESYNKAQLERQRLVAGNVPEQNIAVREAEGMIEKLRESILENTRNLRSSLQQNIARIEKSTEKNQLNIKALPFKVKEFVSLKRRVDIKLELVKMLEGKREQSAITRSSTISNSKIVSQAKALAVPVRPNRRAIQILAVIIGLGLPIIVISVRELLNDKITGRADIEKLTNTPVVGDVGHSYNEKVLIVTRANRSMIAEQFRIIRSNLQYLIASVEKPVIMVTSSFSGEGKSFVSTNIGAAMALTGKKTVILEFDIRKPKVITGLGMPRPKAGISNYLVGQHELDDLIIPVPDTENLFVLPCGPIPPNPAELLLDPAVQRMFAHLREKFDVVVIDTAPVGMVSDAITLGKFADCTLYLVRQGYTYKKQIALIDEVYLGKKLPSIGIVINDVQLRSGYGYYGSGRYGYGYGYGSGYYDDDAVPPTGINKWLRFLIPGKWFKTKR